MNTDNIMLSEEVTDKRPHIIWFHLQKISGIDKSIQTECRFVVARGSGKRGMDSDCLIGMEVLFGVITKF